jgi:hypothetical protein
MAARVCARVSPMKAYDRRVQPGPPFCITVIVARSGQACDSRRATVRCKALRVGCESSAARPARRQACLGFGGAIWCWGDLISFMVRWESSLSMPGTSPSFVEMNVS